MELRKIDWYRLVRETVHEWFDDNCLRLGAAVSYCTLFSVFPLILVVLAIVQALIKDSTEARDAVLNALTRVTGGFRDEFIATLQAVQQANQATGVIGAIVLIMGASWVFSELVSAFNVIWDIDAPSGGRWAFVRTTFFSFALVLASAFLLLVSLVVSAALTLVGNWLTATTGGGAWVIFNVLLNLVVLTLLFAVLLKYLPQTRVAWGDVWLAAAVTAVLWSVLQIAIGFVIAWSNYASYGAIGAVLALVAWVYSSSQILFFGGELSAVYAQRYGSHVRLGTQAAPAAAGAAPAQ
jgi:membrane protein